MIYWTLYYWIIELFLDLLMIVIISFIICSSTFLVQILYF